jgi:CO/xanthine dehydrogenase Mo-binding subunit
MTVVVPSEMVGSRIRRKEDPRLITGSSTYVDDFRLPGTLFVAYVRSIYGHARINTIDTSEARAMPGVAAVVTGKELDDFIHTRSKEAQPDPGTPLAEVLAIDTVR